MTEQWTVQHAGFDAVNGIAPCRCGAPGAMATMTRLGDPMVGGTKLYCPAGCAFEVMTVYPLESDAITAGEFAALNAWARLMRY